MEATGVRKLPRRQIISVNIVKTCHDILEKVPSRVPRVPRGGELPETFSLYLSAQLMFGTVRVYRKQQEYLLVDAAYCKSRVRLELTGAIPDIDLVSAARPDQITMPDPVKLAGRKYTGFDPFFGLLKEIDEENVQLTEIPVLEEEKEEKSPSPKEMPEREEMMSPPLAGLPFRPEFGSPHTVSSIEEITMKELPTSRGLFETEIPGEKDLPPFEGGELQALTEESFQPGLELEEPKKIEEPFPPAEKTPSGVPTPREGRRPRVQRKRRDVAEKEPGYVLPKRLFREELRQSLQDLGMALPPAEVTPRRHRRRRYLRVDEAIQMSKEQLRHNLQTGHTTCRQFVLPMPLPSTPVQLFKRPGSDALWLNKELLYLWEGHCREGMSETESDKNRPIWSVPEIVTGRPDRAQTAEATEESSVEKVSEEEKEAAVPAAEVSLEEGRAEMPSIEMTREISLSRSVTPRAMEASLSREESREESLRRLSRTRGAEGLSPMLEASPLAGRARPPSGEQMPLLGKMEELEALPEEMEISLQSPPSFEAAVVSPTRAAKEPVKSRLFRLCHEESENELWTTFRSVCPTTMTRKQAAANFYALLELLQREKLFVKQAEPYGDIFISTKRVYLP